MRLEDEMILELSCSFLNTILTLSLYFYFSAAIGA